MFVSQMSLVESCFVPTPKELTDFTDNIHTFSRLRRRRTSSVNRQVVCKSLPPVATQNSLSALTIRAVPANARHLRRTGVDRLTRHTIVTDAHRHPHYATSIRRIIVGSRRRRLTIDIREQLTIGRITTERLGRTRRKVGGSSACTCV
jgi:hypothetical protein